MARMEAAHPLATLNDMESRTTQIRRKRRATSRHRSAEVGRIRPRSFDAWNKSDLQRALRVRGWIYRPSPHPELSRYRGDQQRCWHRRCDEMSLRNAARKERLITD